MAVVIVARSSSKSNCTTASRSCGAAIAPCVDAKALLWLVLPLITCVSQKARTSYYPARLSAIVRPHFAMRQYLKSVWVKVGLALLVVGAGPLLFIIVAAAAGLWPDPNPNPIGPGLLFGLTFWPAIICIVVGVVRVRNRRAA